MTYEYEWTDPIPLPVWLTAYIQDGLVFMSTDGLHQPGDIWSYSDEGVTLVVVRHATSAEQKDARNRAISLGRTCFDSPTKFAYMLGIHQSPNYVDAIATLVDTATLVPQESSR